MATGFLRELRVQDLLSLAAAVIAELGHRQVEGWRISPPITRTCDGSTLAASRSL